MVGRRLARASAPARYLDSLNVAYLLTGDPVYRAKAEIAVPHIFSQLDPATGLWTNKGSGEAWTTWITAKLAAPKVGRR